MKCKIPKGKSTDDNIVPHLLENKLQGKHGGKRGAACY
jgi:hypothetical protein